MATKPSKNGSLGMLSREAILQAKRPLIEYPIEEWGGFVYLTTLTAKDRDWWETVFVGVKMEADTIKGLRAKMVSKSVVDADYKPLLSEGEINELDGVIVDRLFDACSALNKFTEEDVKEIEKN